MMLIRALNALRPEEEFTLNDDDLSTIRWNSGSVTTPTQAEIDAKIIELEAVDAAKADAKLSAQAKLAALGLTGEEIAALSN